METTSPTELDRWAAENDIEPIGCKVCLYCDEATLEAIRQSGRALGPNRVRDFLEQVKGISLHRDRVKYHLDTHV